MAGIERDDVFFHIPPGLKLRTSNYNQTGYRSENIERLWDILPEIHHTTRYIKPKVVQHRSDDSSVGMSRDQYSLDQFNSDERLQNETNSSDRESDLLMRDSLHSTKADLTYSDVETITPQSLKDLHFNASFTISDSSYSDGYENSLDPYIGLDLDRMVGQSLPIWSHKKPRSVVLLEVYEDDTLFTLLMEVQTVLDFDPKLDILVVLQPGSSKYVPMEQVIELVKASAILVLPRNGITINIEATETNQVLQVRLQPLVYVGELKYKIETEIGYPVRQQDLICGKRPMENRKRLCDYSVTDGVTVRLNLHKLYDVVLNVETFWRRDAYQLVVDSCMTVGEMVTTVIRKTVSRPDLISDLDQFIPKHILVVLHGREVLDIDGVVGLHKLRDDDTIKITTVGLLHRIDMVDVMLHGEIHNHTLVDTVRVSRFDRWSIVALIVSGITGVKVDCIVMKIQLPHSSCKRKIVSVKNTVSDDIALGTVKAVMYCTDRRCPTAMEHIRVTIDLGGGMNETVVCCPSENIQDVKRMLGLIGIPNANSYKLVDIGGIPCADDEFLHKYVQNEQLDKEVKLKKVIRITNRIFTDTQSCKMIGNQHERTQNVENERTHIKFTVKLDLLKFIACTTHKRVKITLRTDKTMENVNTKIQNRTGLNMESHRLLLCGDELSRSDNVDETMISSGCIIHVVPTRDDQKFFILSGYRGTCSLRIRHPVTFESIRKDVWTTDTLKENSILSMETFLAWYFSVTPLKATYYEMNHNDSNDIDIDYSIHAEQNSKMWLTK